MEILLISFISLLSVCLAVFAMEKKVTNGPTLLGSLGSSRAASAVLTVGAVLAGIAFYAVPTFAQPREGGEANLKLPDLSEVTFFGGIDGHRLLLGGIVICLLGLGFGMAMYMNLKKLPVHRAMREISVSLAGSSCCSSARIVLVDARCVTLESCVVPETRTPDAFRSARTCPT